MKVLTDKIHDLGLCVKCYLCGFMNLHSIISHTQESWHCKDLSFIILAFSLVSVMQYSDSGWFTCQLYPGSYQNEARYEVLVPGQCIMTISGRDAKRFLDWGFDYLK